MTWLNQLPDAEWWQARLNQLGLPLDLDGWPYRPDTDIGPWKVSPCCGAFVEWNNTGVGPVVLICKRCYREMPDGFVDEPPRLPPSQPELRALADAARAALRALGEDV
jgi:hypothetical protein